MKYIVCCLIFLFTSLELLATNENYHNANTFYQDGDYQAAAMLYQELIASGFVNPEIFYNLGNSYFKMGQLPNAILNYERALKYGTRNQDVLHNLSIANARTIDRIPVPEKFFFIQWFEVLLNSNTSDSWAIYFLIFACLTFTALGFLFFSRTIAIRKLSFFLTTLFAAIIILALTFSIIRYEQETSQQQGIIFSAFVNIMSGLDPKAEVSFILHSGTKIKILETKEDWLRIEIPDGRSGWLKSQDIEKI